MKGGLSGPAFHFLKSERQLMRQNNIELLDMIFF